MPMIPRDPASDPAASRGWILLAVGVGTFMSALDGSVVNTLLPVLSQVFHAEAASVEWVTTVYLLVISGLLLGFGRLGDLRGHKPVYLSGFVLFVASSALCGAAPSLPALVGFRAIQALGAAMLFANSPAILTLNFPAEQRGRALGLQATMTYLGLTVGPSLGGWLAVNVGWRSVFYLNVPVGALALVLSWRFVPRDVPTDDPGSFDWGGMATFLSGLVLLLLALDQGHLWGWGSFRTLGAGLAGLALLGGFVAHERRAASPLLNLGLFRRSQFLAATLSAVLNYVAIYAVLFVLPFYLIVGRGFSAAHAGLLLTAQPLIMAIAAPLAGSWSDRIGTRWPATLGMLGVAAGLLMLSGLAPSTRAIGIMAGLAMVGLGTGLFVSPNNSALMGAAPRDQQGVAGGILATARNVGMVLGVGFAGAIYATLAPPGASPASLAHAVDVVFRSLAVVALLGAAIASIRDS